MANTSKIEWTEATWNPVTGCSKVSLGCQNCYAERIAKRLQKMGNKRYVHGFKVTTHPELLVKPLEWRKPRLVFVNSMSDLFHSDVPISFIDKTISTIANAPQHTFQILTKRSDRLKKLCDRICWPQNLWVGVTVESCNYLDRIDDLLSIPAPVKFLSLEPLLGPIPKLPLKGIHWVITGGESGPGARPMVAGWVREIRDQCLKKSVPFFFKQWGGLNKKASGRVLDGKIWDEMPQPNSCVPVNQAVLLD